MCGEDKETQDFSKRRDRDFNAYCKPCQRRYCKEHYRRYKRKHNLRRHSGKLQQVRRNQVFILGYLSKHGCVDCGETNPVVLEFDHVRGVKAASLSQMVADARPILQISEELAKCDVRCANCHRKKTAAQFGWYRFRN